jgi:hypothetical protein
MHNPTTQDTEPLYRVGTSERIKEAIDGMHAAIKTIPNTGVRQALLMHMQTMATEILHMASNLNAHKRVIRDAVEIAKLAQQPGLIDNRGMELRQAVVGAWMQDVMDCMDGTTTDHHGKQIKAEQASAPVAMPRVVQGMAGLPVPHARSA